jgi:excinuclease ABC subunit A
MENIIVKGAREHNLKNIDVTIPRNKLVVITGVSGSGKSTLAFDTLYAEGQRRYVESLSSYARQFLGIMDKPDVDLIEGLSPAISIEQKSVSKNPRSTVGTTTEIYDYLRLLYARIGKAHCPKCKAAVSPQTIDMITDAIMRQKGSEILILSPIVRQKKGMYQKLFEDLNKDGFASVIIDGNVHFTDDTIELDKNKKHSIDVIIDQFVINDRHHVSDSLQTAMNLSKGYVTVRTLGKNAKSHIDKLYTSHSACLKCEIFLEDLSPRHFSFNSPFGACEKCSGLGDEYSFDMDLVIPDASLSLSEGAIKAFGDAFEGYRVQKIGEVGAVLGFSIFKPWEKIDAQHKNFILYGLTEGNAELYMRWKGKRSYATLEEYEGIIPLLERLYQQTESEYRRKKLEAFMRSNPCEACKGKRLKPEALAVLINGKNIIQATELNIAKSLVFFKTMKLSKTDELIAEQILREICSRLGFLESVGLGYLSLERKMESLSGGEAQRIRLATQIGSNLMGVMYVLDEPSIGLHQRDNERLIATLKRLRDIGNTVIVVEHDEDTMNAADHIIDIGPGAGVHGGSLVAQGTAEQIGKVAASITGQYLSGKKQIAVSTFRRKQKGIIEIVGAKENNLKNITVQIPTGLLVCVTGVSGSGKSTLINEVLAKGLMKQLYKSKERPGKCEAIRHSIRDMIVIDQSPIGRTPRSNPVTYTKVFDSIRVLFSQIHEAKVRGYKEGRFSFNVKGGRCENCEGEGLIKIEMNFLPDVYVKCDTCKGQRYNEETLEILYKGKNIHQVLTMTVEESLSFFSSIPSIKRRLQTLYDVGLGYIELGQSATTLSGGEAQRIKLSRELSKSKATDTLYILDEPTTGLHFEDVNKLLGVLDRLVNKGASCVIIEHNLDVIKNADYIIDLGPEGGEGGGTIVATGTPEEISRVAESYTGKFLKPILQKHQASKPKEK